MRSRIVMTSKSGVYHVVTNKQGYTPNPLDDCVRAHEGAFVHAIPSGQKTLKAPLNSRTLPEGDSGEDRLASQETLQSDDKSTCRW